MNVYQAIAAVMKEVGSVGKSRKNLQQGYQFRGIDDVMAHVQGVMATVGLVCVPRVVDREREMMPTKSGGSMASVRLLIDHTFYGPEGDSVICTTLGEAMDSGDKASNKAMSAALKYALTQTLMIPTYEVDRDIEDASPEVAAPSLPPVAYQPSGEFLAIVDDVLQAYPGDGDMERGARLAWWQGQLLGKSREPLPQGWSPSKAYDMANLKKREEVRKNAAALAANSRNTMPDWSTDMPQPDPQAGEKPRGAVTREGGRVSMGATKDGEVGK